MKSAEENIAIWAKQNSCDEEPKISDDKIKGVTIHEFENCSNDRQVVLYSVHEAGHGYLDNFLPAGRHSGGTIDLLWKFFQ